MTQVELERAVAEATGESRRTIRQLGFSLAGPSVPPVEETRGGIVKLLDWDRVYRRRYARFGVH